ncbi:hypothetical protein CEXT_274071 [Caerostris extrusa]|uniref:Uncharacterized protein n=1 Tax=Caerostris extrusa TaxID=172846 RepID=A0AAV4SYR1_CAEEX|nr:hypothetical protein CEXT_274071 [Caerostris extrusa]
MSSDLSGQVHSSTTFREDTSKSKYLVRASVLPENSSFNSTLISDSYSMTAPAHEQSFSLNEEMVQTEVRWKFSHGAGAVLHAEIASRAYGQCGWPYAK